MLEAYQRGDRAALATIIEDSWRTVWRLGRHGFSADVDGQEGHTTPEEDLDRLERATIEILSDSLAPERRAQVNSAEAIAAALEAEARRYFLADAQARGRLRLGPPPAKAPSFELAHLATEAEPHRVKVLEDLGERTRTIVEARFRQGEDAAALGTRLGCGRASLRTQEERARRALARALHSQKLGAARLDAIFAGCLLEEPAKISAERIKERVLSRVEVTPARPFGVRLTEATIVALIAATAFLLLYAGVLPGPDSDFRATAKVEVICKPTCTSGGTATVRLVAPRPSTTVALYTLSGDQVRPFLVAPGGGGLRIPLGARDRPTELPYPVTLEAPLSPELKVVAVLSEERLSSWALSRAALGGTPGTIVTIAEVR
jgi:hypothetical protein